MGAACMAWVRAEMSKLEAPGVLPEAKPEPATMAEEAPGAEVAELLKRARACRIHPQAW